MNLFIFFFKLSLLSFVDLVGQLDEKTSLLYS